MWYNSIVLISVITMISQLDGYHVDNEMTIGRHRRKGKCGLADSHHFLSSVGSLGVGRLNCIGRPDLLWNI